MRDRAQAYWKRFAASVIGFVRRYQEDFFLRTEVNIIGLQIAYAIIILTLTIGALIYLYTTMVAGFVTAIATALMPQIGSPTPETVAASFRESRAQEIFGVAVLIMLATATFGFLVARFALRPARNALAAQKQFIGNIAHELRTPLSIIKTNTEVRLLDPGIPKESREVHESNLEELDRISDIINNLLSLNALIRPERIALESVDVGKIVSRVIEKLDHLKKRKPIRLRVKIDPKKHSAWGNVAALEQILVNVVKNAIHHTSKGEVLVSVGPDAQGALEISVRDTGSGIKPDDLARIFEPFYRGDRARTRTGGAGSGLGLAIVGELVRLLRGQIRMQSAVGKGTHVIITLPSKEPKNDLMEGKISSLFRFKRSQFS